MRMRRKPWTEPVLNDCPFLIESPSSVRGRWRTLFPNEAPVWLEIGCGKGVATAAMGADNPSVNIIAIDEVRHVLAVTIQNVRSAYGCLPVSNLLLSAVDATRIHDTFDRSDGIERIYINFCNPWNNRSKHHKRRLTHPHQLLQYREFLADGGLIYFKTDDAPLFSASKRYLGECAFEILYETDDLHASGYAPNYVSEHERMFMEQGCRIHFLIARMLPEPEAYHLAEPLHAGRK
ncbi:MAG: tRNA (guanosine(46)-N7)-methyltransferase TrmB [Clostridia bacterium]|nr:tRNA (guanosine(46)-N7)-methyltransferase TrmB [Clostridia bacterium]